MNRLCRNRRRRRRSRYARIRDSCRSAPACTDGCHWTRDRSCSSIPSRRIRESAARGNPYARCFEHAPATASPVPRQDPRLIHRKRFGRACDRRADCAGTNGGTGRTGTCTGADAKTPQGKSRRRTGAGGRSPRGNHPEAPSRHPAHPARNSRFRRARGTTRIRGRPDGSGSRP